MCSKPEDPIEYLESCLQKVKELGGCDKVKWDTFVSQEKKTLPPLNGGQTRRSFLRNVMPENSNFPYRRYDRLPPIHQFSIESDTDLSETAELIEEYEVFDPTRPRPKIILVIGGPGSGKGTQSLKIAERYGFQYISVGELLRKKIHSTSSNRKWSLIAKIITTGELAPQETTITEIKQKLMQMPDEVGIVIDGFPRDVAQALSFEDQAEMHDCPAAMSSRAWAGFAPPTIQMSAGSLLPTQNADSCFGKNHFLKNLMGSCPFCCWLPIWTVFIDIILYKKKKIHFLDHLSVSQPLNSPLSLSSRGSLISSLSHSIGFLFHDLSHSQLLVLFFLTDHSKQTTSSNNTRDSSTHGYHQMVSTKIRLIIFFAAEDREALYSHNPHGSREHAFLTTALGHG
ncbi:hypothetical protein FD755_001862 [Muntiacus reevesi]|uniref:Uncharacterized protein n=1 Tax=Muntiacus reevesi TaxID=9886 RepID=A0A5J5N337_MUNRE|nr:hypothetical protein FD755_001862 [Muntiacus reevesi]